VKRLLLVLLLVPLSAQAAGYYTGDLGARGMARGGAFVAAPDSILALHYNPAGLSLLKGLHVEVSLTLLDADFSLARTCPCTHHDRLGGLEDPAALDALLEARFAANPVSNQTPFRGIPFLGVAYGFDAYDLTVGFAAYGPHGAAYDYGTHDYAAALNQSQRYSIISSQSVEANYQLGVGLSPLPGLRIGGAVTIYQTKSSQYLHIYANTVLTPFAENISTNPRLARLGLAFDIPVQIDFERAVAFDWSLGASYEIVSGLVAGASVRGKRSVRADGTLAAEVPEVLSQSGISVVDGGGPVEVEFDLPALARFGLSYRMPETFGVEVAVVYEGWSVHDQIKIRADDVRLDVNGATSALGTLTLERRWNDTVSIRAAVDLEILDPELGVTAGYFFEPSAIPTQRLHASTFDLDKHGVAIGLRTERWGVRVDLVAQHVFMMSTTVSDSLVEMPAVLDPKTAADPAAVGADQFLTRIGNGRYSGGVTMLTAAISASFDELL